MRRTHLARAILVATLPLGAIGLTACNVAAPVIAAGSDTEGVVVPANLPDAGLLISGGTVHFTDGDHGPEQVHTVASEPVEGTTPRGSILAQLQADSTADQAGEVSWLYYLDNDVVRPLREGESEVERFQITISDGLHETSVDITITIEGRYDPIEVHCTFSGPRGTTIDRGNPGSSTWNASGCFTSADGYPLSYSWIASSQSGNPAPSNPSFSDPTATSVTMLDSAWGIDVWTIDLVVSDAAGEPVFQTATFTVTDSGG